MNTNTNTNTNSITIEKRYYNNSSYNIARTIEALGEMVEAAGGQIIESKYHKAFMIENRGFTDDIRSRLYNAEESLKNCTDENRKTRLEKWREGLLADLEGMQKFQDESGFIYHHSSGFGVGSIRFILDGYIYEYEPDENPLFPQHYLKAKITEGKYPDCYLEDLGTHFDGFFFKNPDHEGMAAEILKRLQAAPHSEIIREKRRRYYEGRRYYYEYTPIKYRDLQTGEKLR